MAGAAARKGAANDENGYDALNDKFVNMFDAGIIDPTKVFYSLYRRLLIISSYLAGCSYFSS